MKNIQKILWLGLLVSAVGCNSGVFIDDYLPEVPVVQLSETDSVARINFKSDNWDILNIYGASENVWGVVCDLEGKPDGRNLPLENGANAVISWVMNIATSGREEEWQRTLYLCGRKHEQVGS